MNDHEYRGYSNMYGERLAQAIKAGKNIQPILEDLESMINLLVEQDPKMDRVKFYQNVLETQERFTGIHISM